MKTPNILVAVAHGSEEIETVGVIDTLVRAEANVTVGKVLSQEETGSTDLLCKMSRGVKIVISFD